MTMPSDNVNHEQIYARMKSYVGPAALVFFLYFLFYFPGLIANYLYRKEAKRMESLAGQRLPGTGVINFMYWLNLLNIPLIVIIIAGLLTYAIIKTIIKQFASKETFWDAVKVLAIVLLLGLVYYGQTEIWRLQGLHMWNVEELGFFYLKDYPAVALLFYAPQVGILLGVLFNGWLKALWPILKNSYIVAKEAGVDAWLFFSAEHKETVEA